MNFPGYLFGFSRGAFSARSLAGLIGATGLLKRQRLADLSRAWSYYRKVEDRSPADFCRRHGTESHLEVPIAFLGVWDTVGALGIPGTMLNHLIAEQYEFHDTTPSAIVRVGRQALAIDEQRDEFEPTLWTAPKPEGADIRQVWFAGAHADVGGGYVDRRLADIPLRWMADEAIACGLHLDEDTLPQAGTLDPLAPQHESRQRWSRKDRLTPTIRQIMGRAPEVGLLERLYRPADAEGRPLQPLGEALHDSVRQRFGRRVGLRPGHAEGEAEDMAYRPTNLVPHLG